MSEREPGSSAKIIGAIHRIMQMTHREVSIRWTDEGREWDGKTSIQDARLTWILAELHDHGVGKHFVRALGPGVYEDDPSRIELPTDDGQNVVMVRLADVPWLIETLTEYQVDEQLRAADEGVPARSGQRSSSEE